MNFTVDQIDEISVLSTKYIAEEFEYHEQDNPPEITPGMARNVVKAILSISDKNRSSDRRSGEIRRCSECSALATIFFANYTLCPSCAKEG